MGVWPPAKEAAKRNETIESQVLRMVSLLLKSRAAIADSAPEGPLPERQ
jgi:hypothetical protein